MRCELSVFFRPGGVSKVDMSDESEHTLSKADVVLTFAIEVRTIIQEHSSGRTRELLRLSRQKLRLATGILTGHSQLNRHLSVMGIITDPTCN